MNRRTRVREAVELIESLGGRVLSEENGGRHIKLRWAAPDGRVTIFPVPHGAGRQMPADRHNDVRNVKRFIRGA